ncbi:MAG: host-nuclease inhibitor Gam family protein [Magnetococcales bacterium]|nr:host-nuclease inhibitor Gam family protein [Magnetococcales bacterium]
MVQKKKRSKPEVFHVRDLDHADQVLMRIGELKRAIGSAEDEMQALVDQHKSRADAVVAPLREELKQLDGGLAAFGEYNKSALFKEKRSRELLFGFIGFRRSTEIKPVPKNSIGGILERLQQLKLVDAIKTKLTINKEVMREWPDERLELVGARRVQKDTFFYEIKEEGLEVEP